MLYITFKIQPQKLESFKQFYNYLLLDKQQEYMEQEFEDFMDLEERLENRAMKLCNTFFDAYAQEFLSRYFGQNTNLNERIASLFSYLDVDMEVDFTDLILEQSKATLKFEARSYPYGGMDRLLMVIKALGGQPIESYNGFEVFEFEWTSEYDYEPIVLHQKTKVYLSQFDK